MVTYWKTNDQIQCILTKRTDDFFSKKINFKNNFGLLFAKKFHLNEFLSKLQRTSVKPSDIVTLRFSTINISEPQTQ